MTLSEQHEELIDLTCLAVSDMNKHQQQESGKKFHQCWGVFIEHIMAAMVIPELKSYPKHADAYIFTDDGYGVIMLEVGNMPDSKWNKVYNEKTQTDIRVLRVGKDKSFYLRNPQNTDTEKTFLSFLSTRLDETPLP